VIRTVNQHAVTLFGYTREEMIGAAVELLVPESKRSVHEEHRKNYMQAPRTREMGKGIHLSARTKDGRTFPVEIGLNAVRYGGETTVIALVSDITERKRTEELLKQAALTDPLTGLLNRRAFEEQLAAELSRSDHHPQSFCLILSDIGHFKEVNDTHGHDTGDDVLRHISSLLRRRLRRADTLARWGGEEFIMLLPDTDMEGGGTIAEELRRVVEASPAETPRGRIGVTMSFGLVVRSAAQTAEELMSAADEQLYAAKAAGRNRVKA
jgi:diguanylate cyclase (GGDEF)-like protein/PAS domain S-box-containing protein